MTLNQLKVFEAVCTYSSITRASEALRISEPSVFQQIKSLEDWLGIKLYRKIGRAIELTREGRAVQSDIKAVLVKLQQLESRFKPGSNGFSADPLIIGGSHGVSAAILPSAIAAFKKSYPLVRVILRTKTSHVIERFILDSEVEVALVTNPSLSPALHTIRYRAEKFVGFISATHPLAKNARLTVNELARCPLVIKKRDATKSGDYLKQIESKGFQPNILLECESAEAIKQTVMKGMGLGFLYRDHLVAEINRREIKVVKTIGLKKIDVESYIVYREDKVLSLYAEKFVELLLRMNRERTPVRRASALPGPIDWRENFRPRGQ